MKQTLQQFLEYPYHRVHMNIRLIGCGQHAQYNNQSYECLVCPDRCSCEWVNELKHMSARHCSEQKQAKMLKHAIECMTNESKLLGHDPGHCSCTNCSWVQEALDKYNDLLAHQGIDKPASSRQH